MAIWLVSHARQDVRTSIRGTDPTASDYNTHKKMHLLALTCSDFQMLSQGSSEMQEKVKKHFLKITEQGTVAGKTISFKQFI